MIAEKIKELETKISAAADAKQKVDAMNQLAFEIRNSDTQRSISLCKEVQQLSSKINYPDGNATALANEAFCYVQLTDYELALEKLFEALKIFEEQKNEKGLAQVYYNLCLVYFRFSDFNSALDSITKALTYYQKINDAVEMARCFFQMGFLYQSLNDSTSAIEYFIRSLNLNRETKNKAGEASAIMGLGMAYLHLKEYDKSQEYLLESMVIREEIKDWRGYAASLNAYMNLCVDIGKNEEAEEIAQKGIKLATELGDKMGISRFMLGLGNIYLNQKNADKAEHAFLKALNIAEKINLRMALAPVYFSLSEIAKLRNDYENAFKHFQRFHEVKEEMVNIDAAMKAKSIQFVNKIETAQKEAEINRLKNVELKDAYDIIAEKNKDITDSINYARRIQRSLLASDTILNENLFAKKDKKTAQDHFIFFQPKDIVSGDFYWAACLENGNFALVTADSTGHGVPGAIMSMLNISCLNEAVIGQKLTSPAEILKYTRSKIKEHLSNDGSAEGGKDGMDCSLVSFNFNDKKLIYAAANNPVWIVRKKQLLEFAPDKMPVGKHEKDHVPFAEHKIELQKDDIVYTLTDGMPDQFGGPKGKKFMYKQLKELLITINHLPMSAQKQTLTDTLNSWKEGLEQVDDICIIGVKI